MGQQYSGTEGGAKVGTAEVADLDSWDLTINANLLKTTAYGDDWKRSKPGLKDWSGKASGRWNLGDTQGQAAFQQALLGGTQVNITLAIDDTKTYIGQCWVSSMGVKSAVDSTVDVDFSFDGEGPLTPNFS
jgi:hypothetical protein